MFYEVKACLMTSLKTFKCSYALTLLFLLSVIVASALAPDPSPRATAAATTTARHYDLRPATSQSTRTNWINTPNWTHRVQLPEKISSNTFAHPTNPVLRVPRNQRNQPLDRQKTSKSSFSQASLWPSITAKTSKRSTFRRTAPPAKRKNQRRLWPPENSRCFYSPMKVRGHKGRVHWRLRKSRLSKFPSELTPSTTCPNFRRFRWALSATKAKAEVGTKRAKRRAYPMVDVWYRRLDEADLRPHSLTEHLFDLSRAPVNSSFARQKIFIKTFTNARIRLTVVDR